MRVLITGGAGFIGSHLCERFLQEGHEVMCLDSLGTGRKDNIAHLLSHMRFSFIQHDITQPFFIAGALDQVLHFASPASPRDYMEHPIHTLKVGAIGTHHALGLAKAKGAKFLLASTSEVYGDPQVTPQPESYWGHVNPVGPRSVYDEAKRFAEAMTMAYQRAHGLDVRIARIFNTYGPRMRTDDGRAMPNLITQALRGEPLTVYGDGSQTRSFCYVADLVEGLYRLAHAVVEGPVNLGNPQAMTIRSLAREVIEMTSSTRPIVFQPLPVDDPKVRCPDIAKAKQVLGWFPQTSLRFGLEQTISYLRAQLKLGEPANVSSPGAQAATLSHEKVSRI
jgi:dTDP-glucose 4,6-dehydratase